jgi:hypothetical protein
MLHVILGVIFSFSVHSMAQAEAVKKAGVEGIEGELVTHFVENPFRSSIPAVDPKTRKEVDRVLIGPVFKTKMGSNFDYYRFVTFYKIQSRREQIFSLPVHREQCGVSTTVPFASYTFSYTISAKVSASISIEGIGLSADMTESHTQTTMRQLQASGVDVADHIPFVVKEDWFGSTYLQVYSNESKKEKMLLQDSYDDVPLAVKLVAPMAISYRKYPMPFSARDAAWRLEVDRVVLSTCGDKPVKKGGSKTAYSSFISSY